MTTLTVRMATRKDVPQILGFIEKLAKFEKLSHEFVATEKDIENSLFGARPFAEVLIAELDKPVGFALFFHSYSTFLAKPGLYLEDLFVLPDYRSQGIGKKLLQELAKLAIKRGCGRFEWSVLDWNKEAIKFYARLGAKPMEGWKVNRMTGEALSRLAAGEEKSVAPTEGLGIDKDR